MEFRFNINSILPKRINKITHTLLPENFRGDRREFNECQRLLTRILDAIGEASAKAQGLNKTITNAIKLRDTDHIIYLMIDSSANKGLGSVIGLLKTGSKSLFIVDENGYDYQVKPRCILDFYIHESRQRMGLGKELYEHMLMEENEKPIKLAIDRPSEKFLSFLSKHYGLETMIPQNNKFVVFQGFFDDESSETKNYNTKSQNMASEHQQLNKNTNSNYYSLMEKNTPPPSSSFGRYAASRPPCSMASIIHNLDSGADKRSRMHISSAPAHIGITQESNWYPQEKILQDNTEEVQLKKSLDEESTNGEKFFLQRKSYPYPEESVNNDYVDKNLHVENEMIKNDFDNDSVDDKSEVISEPNETQEFVDTENPGLKDGHMDLKFYHSPLW